MPKKIRELKAILRKAGWTEVPGGGKGSHTKWKHPRVARRLILSGQDGNDAKPKQERDIENAVSEAAKG